MKICSFPVPKREDYCDCRYLENKENKFSVWCNQIICDLYKEWVYFTITGWMRKKQDIREKKNACIHRRALLLLNLKHTHIVLTVRQRM